MSQSSVELDRAWQSTAKVLLGGDVPELEQVAGWLKAQKQPMGKGRSAISGKEVIFPSPDYASGAKCIGMDELGKLPSSPFSINDIKDIDSLRAGLAGQFAYCGNVVLGNSSNVARSSDVGDSHYVLESARVYKSEYIAYSTIQKECKYHFGCSVGSFAAYNVRSHQFTYNNRCLEAEQSTHCSDCYFVHYNIGCSDCMFSFNQKNGRNMIGNRTLQKEQYLKIKSALLEQMRDELGTKKALPMLSDLLQKCGPEEAVEVMKKSSSGRATSTTFENKAPIEAAFAQTCKILLGKAVGSLDECGPWLSAHTLAVVDVPSALGSGLLTSPTYENLKALPKKCMVNLEEAQEAGKFLRMDEADAAGLDFSRLAPPLSKIALLSPQFMDGENANTIQCPIVLSSADCWRVHGCVFMKKSALSTWCNGSESVFGCAFAMDSAYCINCYNSFNLKRCFECDTSRDCSDCYFSHNIENCTECMFCFNVKAKRYAIGNVEYKKEDYLRIKKMVLAEISARLEKNKTLGVSIYNLGSSA